MSNNITFAKCTHQGMVRQNNEDSVLTLELSLAEEPEEISFGLFAVADGVGGHEGGEFASKLALAALAGGITGSMPEPIYEGSLTPGFFAHILTESVQKANREVYRQAVEQGNAMGTTLAAALITGPTAYIANVGDSRVYLLKEGGLRQITVDHSLVAAMAAAGEISPEEIYTHPQRNIITRSLGFREELKVDLFTISFEPGSRLLLCSDGLWEMVRDAEIAEIMLAEETPQQACDRLIEAANENGGLDNISAIIVGTAKSKES